LEDLRWAVVHAPNDPWRSIPLRSARESEVEDLHDQGVVARTPLHRYDNVGRFQVAVNSSAAMKVIEPSQDLRNNNVVLVSGCAPRGCDEVVPGQILERKEVLRTVNSEAEVDQSDKIRVSEFGYALKFT
jgi:hypothetical protein